MFPSHLPENRSLTCIWLLWSWYVFSFLLNTLTQEHTSKRYLPLFRMVLMSFQWSANLLATTWSTHLHYLCSILSSGLTRTSVLYHWLESPFPPVFHSPCVYTNISLSPRASSTIFFLLLCVGVRRFLQSLVLQGCSYLLSSLMKEYSICFE